MVLALLAIGPFATHRIQAATSTDWPVPALPAATGEWHGPAPVSLSYRPDFKNYMTALAGSYSNGKIPWNCTKCSTEIKARAVNL